MRIIAIELKSNSDKVIHYTYNNNNNNLIHRRRNDMFELFKFSNNIFGTQYLY